MPEFVCRVGTSEGRMVTRTIEAASEAAVRAELERQGARLFSAHPSRRGRLDLRPGALVPRSGPFRSKGRVKIHEFLVFNQELVALLKAGLPVVSGLDILLERQKNPHLRKILLDVREQLVAGTALSDAFLSHGDAFPRLYATSLFKAGERWERSRRSSAGSSDTRRSWAR